MVDFDVSDNAIPAVLSQNGRLVTFLSKILQGNKMGYNIVEKDDLAIIIAIWKWRYLLPQCHCKLHADAIKVSFI